MGPPSVFERVQAAVPRSTKARPARGPHSLAEFLHRLQRMMPWAFAEGSQATRAQLPIQTSSLPPPSSRDSSRHCQSLPRNSSHFSVALHRWRQMPPLREMQAKPSGQPASLSHETVQTPPGKLPPISHRADSQSSAMEHDSPGAPASVAHPVIVRNTAQPIIKCRKRFFLRQSLNPTSSMVTHDRPMLKFAAQSLK